MAVPNTTTFSLQDVVDNVVPTTNDLVDCIADATTVRYDGDYYTAPATSLLEFRNYGVKADWAILTFNFSSPDVDLDLRVRMTAPQSASSTAPSSYMGWNSGSGYSPWGHMAWGGDQTGSGEETILINLATLRTAGFTNDQVTVDCRAFWYNTLGSNPTTVTADLYEGGTSGLTSFTFSITSPTATLSQVSANRTISLHSRLGSTSRNEKNFGERVATFSYHTGTYAYSIVAESDTTGPSAPTVTLSNATATSFDVSFNTPATTVGYHLYVTTGSTQPTTYLGEWDCATGTVTVDDWEESGGGFKPLTASTTYYVWAKGYDAAGNRSGFSTVKSIATLADVPNPPTGLSKSIISNDGFRLSWTAPASGPTPTGYDIYDDGVFQVDAGLVTQYDITGEGPDSTSTWTIKAYNAEGDSDASSGLEVTTGPSVNTHQMTEFSNSTAVNACFDTTTVTRYKTGTAGTVSNNDVFYEDSGAITLFSGDNEYWADNFEEAGQSWLCTISGVASSVASC
jgi:hypothetical protein